MKALKPHTIPYWLLPALVLLPGCVAYTSLEGTGPVMQRPQLDLANWLQGPEATKGMIFICGGLDSSMAADVTAKIVALDLQPSVKRITLLINSQGGEVSAWRMIHNSIKMVSKPVDTVNAGNCYSAACAVFASATGIRYAFRNSHFMIHRPQMLLGSAEDRQALEFEVNAFENILRTRATLPAEWFPLTTRPRYFDVRQALQYGLVDKILDDNH